jgi:hypothetical protein
MTNEAAAPRPDNLFEPVHGTAHCPGRFASGKRAAVTASVLSVRGALAGLGFVLIAGLAVLARASSRRASRKQDLPGRRRPDLDIQQP